MDRNLLWLQIVWIIALLVVNGCSRNGSSVEFDRSPTEEAPVALAPGEAGKFGDLIPAAVLASDYELDEVEADSRYKGRVLKVPGLISEIGVSDDGTKYIALSTGWEGTPVQCMFDDPEIHLPDLGVMQKVTAQGTVQGLKDSAKAVGSDDVSQLFYTTGARRVTMSGCSVGK